MTIKFKIQGLFETTLEKECNLEMTREREKHSDPLLLPGDRGNAFDVSFV